MQYEISTNIAGDFATAKDTLFNILTDNQLTVVSDVDVQATLKKKLDKTIAPYHIFGACNAVLAEQILAAEPSAGALLPCTFVLRQEGEHCVVSFMHPNNVLGLAYSDEVKAIADIAQKKVENVIKTLNEL